VVAVAQEPVEMVVTELEELVLVEKFGSPTPLPLLMAVLFQEHNQFVREEILLHLPVQQLEQAHHTDGKEQLVPPLIIGSRLVGLPRQLMIPRQD
jgi:hypothetical protein